MRIVLQRVDNAHVKVNNEIVSSINQGMVLFVGFTHNDNEKIIKAMANKIVNMRIFDDENKIPNINILSLKDTHSILSISQFTLYAECKKGKRPDYLKALNAAQASKFYDIFNDNLSELGVVTKSGIFQAEMEIVLTNNGPYTLVLDSAELFPKLYL